MFLKNSKIGKPISAKRHVASFRAPARGLNLQVSAMKLSFSIPYKVNFGDSIVITGSGDKFGNWDINKALGMEWSEGDIWTARVEVAAPEPVEYKYVVRKAGGNLIWMDGPNISVKLEDSAAEVAVMDKWDRSSQDIAVKSAAPASRTVSPIPAQFAGAAAGGGGGRSAASSSPPSRGYFKSYQQRSVSPARGPAAPAPSYASNGNGNGSGYSTGNTPAGSQDRGRTMSASGRSASQGRPSVSPGRNSYLKSFHSNPVMGQPGSADAAAASSSGMSSGDFAGGSVQPFYSNSPVSEDLVTKLTADITSSINASLEVMVREAVFEALEMEMLKN